MHDRGICTANTTLMVLQCHAQDMLHKALLPLRAARMWAALNRKKVVNADQSPEVKPSQHRNTLNEQHRAQPMLDSTVRKKLDSTVRKNKAETDINCNG